MTLIDTIQARWHAWWPELEPREQRMIGIGAALVLLALVWWIALAPALRTLSAAPAEHAQLDIQLQQMARLQTQAKALQAQPRANRDDSLRALETSARQSLGPNAQLQASGSSDGVNLSLRQASADTLAQWFSQARSNARAVPREVHLTRSGATQGGVTAPAPPPASPAGPAADPAGVRWDGTLVMSLPAR